MRDALREQWESNAEAYAELIGGVGTPFHQQILVPALDRLIGEVSGIRLLDAGCGEGYLSRRYARRGARVVGIDISERLIRLCRLRAEEEGLDIEYRVGDVCDLSDIEAASFDVVLSNLVLLNVPCLEVALREFNRVLVDGGRVVFSIVHPAFDFYGPGRWEMGEKDRQTRRRRGLHFVVDRYADERSYERVWRTKTGDPFPRPITFYHRMISTYARVIRSTGFIVDIIDEPTPVVDDPFFDREKRIPMFMVFRLLKERDIVQ